MHIQGFGVVALLFALSGCVVVDSDVTESGFGLPPAGLNNVQVDNIGNTFGTVGLTSGTNTDGAAAYASLVTAGSGSPLPASDVTYTGVYEVIGIENIVYIVDLTGPDFIEGNNFSDAGTISVTADVSSNTLIGTDGTLSVLGSLAGSAITGTVTYDGQGGDLSGVLFEEGGVAAFHGNDDDRVFAGGLTLVETP